MIQGPRKVITVEDRLRLIDERLRKIEDKLYKLKKSQGGSLKV